VVERWRQLPLDRALSYAGRVRGLVQSLADRVAEVNGVASSVVPDLGPATLMDQLRVQVHDASAVEVRSTAEASAEVRSTAEASAEVTSTEITPTEIASTLAEDLASLRRGMR
jgi:hypothetical protein